jgi:transposase
MEECLKPSASDAGLALKHGINANWLRNWIKLHQQRLAGTSLKLAPIGTAFVPVVEVGSYEAVVAPESAKAHRHTPAARTSSPAMTSARLTVLIPNVVTLRLECSNNNAPLLSAAIETLGRCDVPHER